MQRGDKVALLIASGQTVLIGSKIESNGSGLGRVMSSAASSYLSEDSQVAVAAEASGGALGADTLILCRIK